MNDSYEFVFSFRSPFAWIAAEHFIPMLDSGLEVKWTAFFPLPTFPNFGAHVPGKMRYEVRDIIRTTQTFGMKLGRPLREDPDWAIPHAAFEFANRQGAGPAFALALMAERWSESEDIATDPILARAAESVGLDAQGTVAASHDGELHRALRDQIQRAYDERGVFGVPMLITPDETQFWGWDRIEWAIRYGFVPGEVPNP
jgi:2-hydroxychromene-2-carboxylate isomerase